MISSLSSFFHSNGVAGALRQLRSWRALFGGLALLAMATVAWADGPDWTSTSGSTSVTAGQSVTFNFTAHDPDGNLTQMEVAWRTPSGAVYAIYPWFDIGGPTGQTTISRTVTFNQGSGTYELWVNARDADGNTRDPWAQGIPSERISISANGSVNHSPTCSVSASSSSITAGQSVVIYVSGSDVDGNLRYVNVDQVSPTNGYYGPGNSGTETPPNNGWYDLGGNYGNYTRALTLTLNTPGTYWFRGAVNDGTGWNYSPSNVAVTVSANVNHAPTCTVSASASTIQVGQSVVVSVAGSDVDGNLRYINVDQVSPTNGYYGPGDTGYESPPNNGWYDLGANYSSRTRNLTLTLRVAGTYVFRGAVNDGSGWYYSPSNFTVNVVAGNSPPSVSITPAGTQTITLGQSITFTSTASDSNGDMTGHNFDWRDPDGNWAWAGGTGMTTNVNRESYFGATSSSSRSILCTPTRTGTFRVRWGGLDSAGWSYSGEYDLIVNPAPVNHPPSCTVSASATSISAGQTVVISVNGTDVDGNLRYLNVDQVSPVNGYYGPGDTGTETPPNNGSYDLGANYSTRTRNLTLTLNSPGTYVFRGAANDGSGWNYSPSNVTVTVSGTGWQRIYTSSGTIYSNEITDDDGNGTGEYESTSDWHFFNVPANGTVRVYTTGWTDTAGDWWNQNWSYLMHADSGGGYLNFLMTSNVVAGQHHVLVSGQNGDSSGDYQICVDFQPAAPPPAAPTASSATNVTSTGFTANWSSVSGATGYRLDVSTNSGFTTFVAGYQDRDVATATSFSIGSLAMGTNYFYRVRAVNSGGASSSSNTIQVTTTVTPPSAPTANAATGVSSNSFTANWSSVAGASGYRLDVATNASFTAFVPNYQDRDVSTATASSISGLTTGATYYYRVRAYNSAGTSANSATITVTTVTGPIYGNGWGLKAEFFHGQFDWLGWETTENVDHDWGGGGPGVGDSWSDDDTGDSGEDNFSGRWTGRVQPKYSGAYTFITSSDDGVRLWVNGVLAVDNWTDHGWTDNSTPAIELTAGQFYEIKMEFYENGGDAVAKLSWQSSSQGREIIPGQQLYRPAIYSQPAISSANATGIVGQPWVPTVYNGGAGTGQWEFCIANYTNFSPKPWTPTATGTYNFYILKRGDTNYGEATPAGPYTLTISAPLGAPTANAATNVTSSGFTANWTSVSGATSYRLDVATNNSFSSFVTGYSDRDVGNVTSFPVSGLAASTTYYYRVRAVAGSTVSGNSGTISVTTSAPPVDAPGSPVNLRVTAVTSTTISLAWDAPAGTAPAAYVIRRGGTTVGSVAGNTLTFTDSGLTAATTYTYQATAANSNGVESAGSNTVSGTTSSGSTQSDPNNTITKLNIHLPL